MSTPTKSDLLAVLPPLDNKVLLIKQRQDVDDIINEILVAHNMCEGSYDLIYPYFDTADLKNTCKNLWDFCKYKLTYKIEPGSEQTVRTPTAILQRDNVDCKHYSLFIAGVLDAIKFNEGDNFEWCYRFASYKTSLHIEHVFVVVKVDGREIWIDPVLDYFDLRQKPTYFIDEKPMSLYMISGVGETEGKTVSVNPAMAEMDFNKWVNLDLFGIRGILKSNPSVLHGQVKQYYEQNGLSFDDMLLLLNNPLKY